jgi:colanic acid biosynthesis glycosyl transferase WcaI
MRLLVVSQYFWPENFRINDLVAELVDRGHQVTVLTGCPNYPEGKIFREFRDEPLKFSSYEGAEVIRVPMLPRGNGGLRLVLNYLSFMISALIFGPWKLRRRKYDAVFTYQPSPITVGVPAAFIAKIKRAPMMLWVLDLWPDTLEAIGVVKSKFILRIVSKIVSFVYNHSDLILAQSNSFIPHIQKLSKKGKRILYFPSWSESIFNVQDTTIAKEVPEKENCFSIMFAGNVGDAQDFPAILSAAEALKENVNIRWLIIGDGRMLPWVEAEIKRRELQSSFLLLGRYPLERMPSFFNTANVLLVSLKDKPIFSMTIPGKLQSYLAMGKPIVAMLNGEGSNVVKESGAGLVCPAGDFNGLVKIISELSDSSSERMREMGVNALNVSEDRFNRDRLMSQLEEFMLDLVRNKN